MTLILRPATAEDGAPAMAVLRRSITELCQADHNGDPAKLAPWLVNKTESTWRDWVAVEGAVLLVAERANRILGVAMMSATGTIQVNYVSPDVRFQGVSSALMAALEETARTQGLAHVRLNSTVTARRFYLDRGYRPVSPGSDGLEKSL